MACCSSRRPPAFPFESPPSYEPYGTAGGAGGNKCKTCKSPCHQAHGMYCHACAYKVKTLLKTGPRRASVLKLLARRLQMKARKLGGT